MDKKEEQLIKYYHDKFKNRTFDEKDVYAFLILIRNQSKGYQCINELSDFIAHRDKDRGYIKNYLKETKSKFENIGKKDDVIVIEEVFSFKEIKSGVNGILKQIGFEELTNEQINDFILCIISILQQVRITHKNKVIGHLEFAISSKKIQLLGNVEVIQDNGSKPHVLFPVLSAKNNYYPVQKIDKHDSPLAFEDVIIEVININGKFHIGVPDVLTK